MNKNNRKKIAILYDCVFPFVPGGGQKRLFEISRRLVSRGWQIDWYALKSWNGNDSIVIEGITIHAIAPSVELYDKNGKRSLSQTFYYGFHVAKCINLMKYDFIHAGQFPYFHLFSAKIFSIFGRAKFSVDWWEVWDKHWLNYYGKKGWLGIVLERFCARIANRIIAISGVGESQLNKIGISLQKIQVIPNGINFAIIANALAFDNKVDLIYVGRLQNHKNVDLLIDAVHILHERGNKLSLAVIGDGPEFVSLNDKVQNLELTEYIKFLGALENDEDVYRHLRSASVFVHPSTKEGGGSITSLEANAAGIPVVAFRHDGGISKELIQHEGNGIWVDHVNAEQLAVGIEKAMILSANATNFDFCQEFSKKYDWENIADQYESFFTDSVD